jgi:hypothetical protein
VALDHHIPEFFSKVCNTRPCSVDEVKKQQRQMERSKHRAAVSKHDDGGHALALLNTPSKSKGLFEKKIKGATLMD